MDDHLARQLQAALEPLARLEKTLVDSRHCEDERYMQSIREAHASVARALEDLRSGQWQRRSLAEYGPTV